MCSLGVVSVQDPAWVAAHACQYFGVHLPVCGARGRWRACTCSIALLCGNVCERACEHGWARDGPVRGSVWAGGGGGVGKRHCCRLLPEARTLLLLSLF